MHTPSPAADQTPRGQAWPRRPGVTWPRAVLYVAPVAAIALYGALWIALHPGGGRSSTHTFFQSLALAESVIALLLPAQAGRCARRDPGRIRALPT